MRALVQAVWCGVSLKSSWLGMRCAAVSSRAAWQYYAAGLITSSDVHLHCKTTHDLDHRVCASLLQVDEHGGAVACTAANCSLIGCTLTNNSAKLGGGIWSSSAKLLALQEAEVAGNTVRGLLSSQ